MRRIPGDAWVSLVLLAAGIACLVELWGAESSGAYLKTTSLPIGLAGILVALSLVLLSLSVRQRAVQPPEEVTEEVTEDTAPVDHRAAFRVVTVVVLTAAYIAALPWFGYLLSTGACLGVMALLYGTRAPVTIVGVMVGLPLLLQVFFEKYMIVLLPSARLFP